MNSYPEVDFRPALGFRVTVSWDLWKNFHTFYGLVTSYPEVDFVLLSVVATPVENPQVQFLDQLFMPVEVPTPVKFATGAVLEQSLHGRCCVWCLCPDSAENGGDSTGAVLGQGEHARCYWSGAERQTAQTTVENPQLQFLDKFDMPVMVLNVVATPVEIPQAQFLDKVYMSIVVSGAAGQTVQKTVEYPQLQFLDKFDMPVMVLMWWRRPWRFHRRSSWTRSTCPSWCLVPMARQCRKLWIIHSSSSWTRCSCLFLVWCR